VDGLTLRKLKYVFDEKIRYTVINSATVSEDTFILHLYDGKNSLRFDFKAGLNLKGIFRVGKFEKLGKASVLEILNGAGITEIKQRSYDRILIFYAAKRRPSGKKVIYRIVYELAGKNSNIFVISDSDHIIFKLNNNNIDPEREVETGQVYRYFKLNKRYDLDSAYKLSPKDLDFNNLIGFYPKTAEYAEKVFNRFEKVPFAIEYLKEELSDKRFYTDDKGKIYPFKINDDFKEITFEEFGSVSERKDDNDYNLVCNRLIKYYKKRIKKDKKLVEKLKEDLANAKEFHQLRHEADLITNNLHILKQGEGEYELTDYFEDGIKKVSYSIKRGERPEEKAEKLYEKSRKLERSVGKIRKRIDEIQNRIFWYEEKLFYLEDESIKPDERELFKEYSDIFGSYEVKKSKTKEVKRIYHIKLNEADIYLGKNSRGNHELVFDFASSDDLWLHAQGLPSSHAIIRKNESYTEEEIETAARCVAYLSKARLDSKVNVDYTLKKYVKKPKHTPEGFVIYDRFKTITVAPMSREEFRRLIKSE